MTLLQMSATGGITVLVFALLRLLLGQRLPRRAFLWMWTAALVRLLLPVRVCSSWSVYGLLRRGTVPSGAVSAAPAAGESALHGGETALVQGSLGGPEAVLAVLWAMGAVLVGGYFLLAWCRWRRRFRAAVPVEIPGAEEDYPLRRPLRIRRLEGLGTPLTYGVLAPVILLPSLPEEEQLRCILTHEYVHIRRFDALRKLALAAAAVIHWFNPAVWLLFHLAGRDMELVCDALALERLGERRRKTYAVTLLQAARQQSEEMPLCSFFGRPLIEERIRMMKQKRTLPLRSFVLAVVLLLAVTTAFATTAEREELPYRGAAEAAEETLAPTAAEPIEPEQGLLLWPAEGCGTVSAPFGRENPVTGAKLDHITVAGERGVGILAAADGTVVNAAFQSRRGNYVEIDHGNGITTMYAHCDEIFVGVGESVTQGQCIAAMGQSGMATGPCLGFYLACGGECVDPMEWFAQ